MATRPPRYAMVEGVRIDLEALSRLAHACRPQSCRVRTSCCRTYEVYVDRKEQARITNHLDDAARYVKDLCEEDGFADPFEDTEGGSCLATDENGQCVFAYRHRRGHLLCSLHSAALDRGLSPYRVKPFACALWPLFYVESDPPLLTVQEGVSSFPCNTARKSGHSALDPGVAGILRDIWGARFLEGVERALGA